MGHDNNKKEYILSKSNISVVVRDFIKKTSEIEDNKSLSPEDLVEAYRKGYGLDKYNFISSCTDDKMLPLGFDLMICKNPLDENKEQIFYTFFSKKETYYQKLLLAEIYQWYLDHYIQLDPLKLPFYHP